MLNTELEPFLAAWNEKWSRLPQGAKPADRRALFEVIAREMRLPTPEGVDTTAEHWVPSAAGNVRVRIFRHQIESRAKEKLRRGTKAGELRSQGPGLRLALRFCLAVPAGWTLLMIASGLGLGALVLGLPPLLHLPVEHGVGAEQEGGARPADDDDGRRSPVEQCARAGDARGDQRQVGQRADGHDRDDVLAFHVSTPLRSNVFAGPLASS